MVWRRTVLDVRRGNRSAVMWTLYFGGPMSRQDIGTATGLSPATVSNVVNALMADGLLAEAGTVESDGGRPRTLLRVDPGYGCVIGADVGETRIRMELFDVSLEKPLAAADVPLRPGHHEVEVVVGGLAEGVERLTREAGVPPVALLGVGVGVPGIVEHGAETLVHGQAFGWEAVPFARSLREAGLTAPVFADNGAATLGQAESWFGAGRGARHAIVALIGSGVGAGVITEGTRYYGATSSAAEWGHTPLVVGGRACRCGARGCLEAYVGAEAILARYAEVASRNLTTGAQERDLADMLRRAEVDRAAQEVVTEVVGYLGAGIGGLINMFNPERVIIGGWAGAMLCSTLLPRIREAAAGHALRQPFGQVTIEPCALGDDAVTRGAASLPVEYVLSATRRPRADDASIVTYRSPRRAQRPQGEERSAADA